MPNLNNHLIGKQEILLRLSKIGEASAVQQRVSELYYNTILPEVEKLLDRYSDVEELIAIPQLEIDLGQIKGNNWENTFTELFLKRFEEALALQLHGVDNQAVERTPLLTSYFQHWLNYLEKGYLPWNAAPGLSEETLHRSVLATLAGEAAALEQLRRLLTNDAKAFERLLSQHPEDFLKQITAVFTAQKQDKLVAFRKEATILLRPVEGASTEIKTKDGAEGLFFRHFWKTALEKAVIQGKKLHWQELATSFLASLAPPEKLPFLLSYLLEQSERQSPSARKNAYPAAGAIIKSLLKKAQGTGVDKSVAFSASQPGAGEKETKGKNLSKSNTNRKEIQTAQDAETGGKTASSNINSGDIEIPEDKPEHGGSQAEKAGKKQAQHAVKQETAKENEKPEPRTGQLDTELKHGVRQTSLNDLNQADGQEEQASISIGTEMVETNASQSAILQDASPHSIDNEPSSLEERQMIQNNESPDEKRNQFPIPLAGYIEKDIEQGIAESETLWDKKQDKTQSKEIFAKAGEELSKPAAGQTGSGAKPGEPKVAGIEVTAIGEPKNQSSEALFLSKAESAPPAADLEKSGTPPDEKALSNPGKKTKSKRKRYTTEAFEDTETKSIAFPAKHVKTEMLPAGQTSADTAKGEESTQKAPSIGAFEHLESIAPPADPVKTGTQSNEKVPTGDAKKPERKRKGRTTETFETTEPLAPPISPVEAGTPQSEQKASTTVEEPDETTQVQTTKTGIAGTELPGQKTSGQELEGQELPSQSEEEPGRKKSRPPGVHEASEATSSSGAGKRDAVASTVDGSKTQEEQSAGILKADTPASRSEEGKLHLKVKQHSTDIITDGDSGDQDIRFDAYKAALANLYRTGEMPGMPLSKTPAGSAGKGHRPSRPIPEKEMETGTTLFIDHAGMVLLHPFLPSFFRTVGLLDDKEFKDEASRHRAVHLLHYLASKETGLPEYALLLPKMLCAIPFDLPIDRYIELSATEMEEGENLLAVAIEHWGALGKTSPDGLREGFLQREGKLEKRESGWYLTVEKQTVDILLGRLPWGLSMVKFPWMKEILRVEWG